MLETDRIQTILNSRLLGRIPKLNVSFVNFILFYVLFKRNNIKSFTYSHFYHSRNNRIVSIPCDCVFFYTSTVYRLTSFTVYRSDDSSIGSYRHIVNGFEFDKLIEGKYYDETVVWM